MKKEEKGTIVIISSIAVMILLALGAYFLNDIIVELKIAQSVESAERAYYLAESGINEAIWKLKNDNEWKENFVAGGLNPDGDGNYWNDSFEREMGGGTYEVEIINNDRGRGEIIATAEVPFLGRNARRKIKIMVFRGFESITEDGAIFSGGQGANININHSELTVNKGNLFSTHNLILTHGTVEVHNDEERESLQGKILSGNNFLPNPHSDYQAEAVCSANICDDVCQECPHPKISIPKVDFDSEDSDSFKSRAEVEEMNNNCSILCGNENDGFEECSNNCILSSEEFRNLLWDVGKEGTLILDNEITYVTGPIEVKGGRRLEVGGALISDGTLTVGEKLNWQREGREDEGVSHLEIKEGDPEKPVGILSKRKINFGEFSLKEELNFSGVIYAGDAINMVSVPQKMNITGGIISRKINLMSLQERLEVTLDNERINYGLGHMVNGSMIDPEFSSIIRIEHWEEVY